MPSNGASWQRALYLPLTILAWLAVGVVSVWLLSHFTRTILLIVLSSVLAFAFTPLARLLERWLPRPLALGLAYVIGVGAVLGLGVVLVATAVGQVAALVESLPSYAARAQSI